MIAGDHQPPAVHAFVHGSISPGQYRHTVFYTDPVNANPVNRGESLKDLVGDMRAGKVDVLVIMGGNPPMTPPPSSVSRMRLQKSERSRSASISGFTRMRLAELCQWHVNEAHYLEAWGDLRLRRHGEHYATFDCAAVRREERS